MMLKANSYQSRLNNMCSIDSLSVTSKVSPCCLEGNAYYRDMMSVTGDAPPDEILPGAGHRWYANISLSATSSVETVIGFQDGAEYSTNVTTWAEFNILYESNTIVRLNDSLLLIAVPAGATNGTVEIEIVGVTNYTAGIATPIAHEFATTGTYTVVGVHDNGTVTSNSVEVKVVGASFPTNAPAAWLDYTRSVVCSNVSAPNITLEVDEFTEIASFEAHNGGGSEFDLTLCEVDDEHYITARLWEGGPILDSVEIEGFWVVNTVEMVFRYIETLADGSSVIQTRLVAGHIPDTVTLELGVFIGGATFDDGSILKYIDVSDLSEVEEYTYRMILSSDVNAPCHKIEAYQDDVFVGK